MWPCVLRPACWHVGSRQVRMLQFPEKPQTSSTAADETKFQISTCGNNTWPLWWYCDLKVSSFHSCVLRSCSTAAGPNWLLRDSPSHVWVRSEDRMYVECVAGIGVRSLLRHWKLAENNENTQLMNVKQCVTCSFSPLWCRDVSHLWPRWPE